MRIKEIRPSPKKQGHILVKLEDGAILRVTEEELLHFGLLPGMELDEGTLAELAAAARRSSVKAAAAGIIGSRALSKKELEQRLTRKGASQKDAQEAADWLEDIGAIDDANYAAVVARHYAQRGYGPGRVREELRRRGIHRDLWDQALEELPEAAETIDAYIQKKCRGAAPDAKELKRIADGLLRRGFRWGDVKAALERLGAVED